MSALPDAATFQVILADPRFPAAVAIAIVAGLVRGFSGFGSPFIYIPLMSAIYGPRDAVGSFVLIDVATGLAFALRLMRDCNWREVLPLAGSAGVAAPFGAMILQFANPLALRWLIVGLVSFAFFALASGWRYRGTPLMPITLGVGFLAGLFGGAVQISGPPVVVYWLAGSSDARMVRANFAVFFLLLASVYLVIYLLRGLITPEMIAMATMLGVLHIASIGAGAKLFNLAAPQIYRRVALAIVALSVLVSLPLFDGWLR
ncbi:MAG: sulfite exporter TauE/SafE [Xanthobacteraceae bacterium]|nr:sulfite exporter TauE/SafE [Xanthobacteraceae bacterium]